MFQKVRFILCVFETLRCIRSPSSTSTNIVKNELWMVTEQDTVREYEKPENGILGQSAGSVFIRIKFKKRR